MQSPCINICKIKGKICLGCKRTLEEIANWTKYTNKQRQLIIKQLNHRT